MRNHPKTKTVGGIKLTQIPGKYHHKWSATLAGETIIFTPYTGRFNNRPNAWYSSSVNADCKLNGKRFDPRYFHVERVSLRSCVIASHHEAHHRIRALKLA